MGKSRGNGGFKVGSGLTGIKSRAETPSDEVRKKRREVQDAAFDQSQAGTAPGMRCGQVRPSAMGRTMLGGDACAMVEPSTNCTMECTMDCG